MGSSDSTANPAKNVWMYGLAAIFLLAAASGAYLVSVSFRSRAVEPQIAQEAVAHAFDAKPVQDQLKQEADARAKHLLAQLRKSPEDAFLLAEIGKIYYQMRQFSIAAKYYEDSARIKPDAAVLVKLGGAHHFNRDDDKAIGAWNQALRLEPDNADALFNIAYVKWHDRGDIKGAIAAWQKLLKSNPNHPKRALVEDLIVKAQQQPETPMSGNK